MVKNILTREMRRRKFRRVKGALACREHELRTQQKNTYNDLHARST